MAAYAARMKAVLTPVERAVFAKLNSPTKIQDFLDDLPVNFEMNGETYMSPCRVLRTKTAHCFEGAVFAAAALAYHGARPLLLDLKTIATDQDHVVALFKKDGRWGALSKTNHAILRYRDPIYKTIRELAMSYVHEYVLDDGRKTMRSYSAPFDLSLYEPQEWLTNEEDLIDILNDLDDSRHFPIAPAKIIRQLRKASAFETLQMTWADEWVLGKKPRRSSLRR